MKKYLWSTISNAPLSVLTLRALYTPENEYRITPNNYNSGAKFCGTFGVPAKIHVLAGSCKYKQHDEEIVLNQFEVLEIEKGDYSVEILGNDSFRFVAVYKLPIRGK